MIRSKIGAIFMLVIMLLVIFHDIIPHTHHHQFNSDGHHHHQFNSDGHHHHQSNSDGHHHHQSNSDKHYHQSSLDNTYFTRKSLFQVFLSMHIHVAHAEKYIDSSKDILLNPRFHLNIFIMVNNLDTSFIRKCYLLKRYLFYQYILRDYFLQTCTFRGPPYYYFS